MNARAKTLLCWFNQQNGQSCEKLQLVSGDASFRRYFRPELDTSFSLLVDAPPSTEKNQQFSALSIALRKQHLAVPEVFALNLQQGFLQVEDLGQVHLADVLHRDTVKDYYTQALSLTCQLQQVARNSLPDLLPFDHSFVSQELAIFEQWFIGHHYTQVNDNWREQCQWEHVVNLLSEAITSQPQAAMHRDFHSRNLMLHQQQLHMIDFQDMVYGPVCYDPVSLLRDCYVVWPEWLIDDLALHYFKQSGLLERFGFEQCQRWFDLTGLQRHIKVLGIFSRLHHRDNKSVYLKDLPLTADYVLRIAQRYSELSAFAQWFSPIHQRLQNVGEVHVSA